MFRKQQWIYFLLLFLLALTMLACVPKSQDQKYDHDILSDTSWISDTDYSQIIFTGDRNFQWYQSKEEKDDNYFKGTYILYIGQEAMDHITKTLSEYGVTEEELQEVFARNEEFELDNFVALTLSNDLFVLEGEEQFSEEKETYYYGFIREEGSILDIANMDSGLYAWFVKE